MNVICICLNYSTAYQKPVTSAYLLNVMYVPAFKYGHDLIRIAD